MAIKTRETTADGVTNNNAPLTNAELDNNFVELQQNKVDSSGDTMTGNLTFGDNDKAIFGTDGSDLEIYHDGGHNRIDNNTGNLYIRNFSDDRDIYLQSDNGSGGLTSYVHLDGSDGSVNLRRYGAIKLTTTSTGIDVTGTVTADSIDSSGRVAVGTNSNPVLSTGGTTVGTWITPADYIAVGSESTCLQLNRQSTDGDIAVFRYNGSTIGNIGVFANDLNIGTADTGIRFVDSTDSIFPFNPSTSENKDAAIDLGASTRRFKDLYLSGGVYTYNGGSIFNQDGGDNDFRVESDSNTHALFVEGSSGKLALGTSTTAGLVHAVGQADYAFWEYMGLGSPLFVLRRARGTPSAPTQTQANDFMGHRFQFRDNASNYLDAGSIYVQSLDNVTSTTRKSQMQFQTAHSTGTAERLRLDSDSTVFNESGYDTDFRVESDTNTHALFVNGAGGQIAFTKSDASENVTSGHGWGWHPGGGAGFQSIVQTADSGNGCMYLNKRIRSSSGTNTLIQFMLNDGSSTNYYVGNITGTSSGTTYNTTSDRRLKDNIETIIDGTDKLMAMNPVTHTWKADPDAPAVHGFIAQEMQDVIPEAVSGEDGGDEMMSMDYGRITPVIVAALQDAHREIQNLKAEIAALKEK